MRVWLAWLLCCGGLCSGGDHYSTLGVKRDASASAIKSAYRQLALSHHPDRTRALPEREQSEKQRVFERVNEAFEVLGDPARRQQYDVSQPVGSGGSGRVGEREMGGKPGVLREDCCAGAVYLVWAGAGWWEEEGWYALSCRWMGGCGIPAGGGEGRDAHWLGGNAQGPWYL